MPIYIKTPPDIEKMRAAGKIAKQTMDYIESLIKPGVTELYINNAADEFVRSKGAVPSFLNYRKFPKSICVAVNDVVLHGVPGKRVLREGDIIGIDIGVYHNGFHGDMARTFPVGRISAAARKLLDVTERSFFEGAMYAKQGLHLHQISGAIEDYVISNGFNVLKEYYGHGIGRKVHESPDIPCYRVKTKGVRLQKGMTLAVEPMVTIGSGEVYTGADGHAAITADGSLGAHYENTILVTDGEPEFLTL